ncbi:4-galactosyl-N-acetylglucosaminide 3-alpha-L-fucosyltransferase 9-like [Clavelina lepadiformis]|uniref:4-galactosyl-N-acetylglucosaminide 3-alpha-L-fucosyltransferase 9-like n=1 Tax=Clavelina lepadiformis TaxID=159417 RepID=UPI0040437189
MVAQVIGKKQIVVFAAFMYVTCLLGMFHVVSRKYWKRVKTGSSFLKDKKVLILNWDEKAEIDRTHSSNCIVTHNRSRIKEADAILFHHKVISEKDMPWKYYRRSDQIYIWRTREAPSITEAWGKDLRYFDRVFFNWTSTLRRDSDVIDRKWDRGEMLRQLPKGKKVVDDIIKEKNKLAVCDGLESFEISACDGKKGQRRRLEYAMELDKAGIKFSRYGNCFEKSRSLPKVAENPAAVAIRNHKFYFAFENSLHCKDYITEKVWKNSLENGVVPIVWGPTKEDILSVAPLDSFIFAEDFESPAELAKYLKFLDENDEEYRKYFKWREDETMTDERMVEMIKERYPNLDLYIHKRETLCDKLLQNNEP